MIYVEYVSRRAGVELAEFHAAVNEAQAGWDDAYGEDRLLLNVGRTWRLGPEPEYIGVWHSPAHGLGRIDDWDRIFRDGALERHEQLFRRVAPRQPARGERGRLGPRDGDQRQGHAVLPEARRAAHR